MKCNYCDHKDKDLHHVKCECGSYYCGFSCLVKSLHDVGVYQHTFDELDRCGKCAVEKLKAGKLVFPQGDKYLNRLLVPSLLIYVVSDVEKPKKRKKKIGENQMALF